MKKPLFCFICLSLFMLIQAADCCSAGTPEGDLSGRVIETESQNPIIGANILLEGTMLGAATDSKGYFTISHIPPGEYTVLVTAIGYKKAEKEVHIENGQEQFLSLDLDETVVLMDGVAVTASRYQQALGDIPVSLSLVPAKEIEQRNITSLDQALRYVPGVNATDGGQVSIRGSSGFNWGVGSRVLVMVNGNPFMAGDMWNVNWYAIPTTNIKQVEVMKGAGSALYGSSAMGGVINIITEDPDEGNHIQVRSFSGFYNEPSFSEWMWTDKRLHFEGTSVDFTTHIGSLKTMLSSNYQNTTGYKENDDHQILNFMANLGYPLSDKLRFDILTGYGRNEGGFFIYWKSLRNPYANGSDPKGYSTRSLSKSTYAFPSVSYVLNNRFFLTLKGRYNHVDSEDLLKQQKGAAPDSSFRASNVVTQGGELQANWQVNPKGILVAGWDFQKDHVESIQFGSRRVSRTSYYLQYEQRLWGKLKATVGSRYDWEDAEGVGIQSDWSHKLGLNYTFFTGMNARLSVGQGFRIPTVAERFLKTKTSGIWLEENPFLRPERSFSAETGLKAMLAKSMSLDLAVFYTTYNDLIEPQLDRNADQKIVVRFQNISKARIIGFDLSHITDWWSKLMSTRLGYTYTYSKDLSPGSEYGEPLKYRSRHMLYLSHDINMKPFSIGLDFRYVSKIERVDQYHKVYIKDIDKLVPTYVAAVRLGIKLRHYSFRVSIDNLFQYNYILSPANMAPPRTIVLQFNINY